MALTMRGSPLSASGNITIEALEVLRPGTYTDANGKPVVVTAAHVAEMAAVYDPDLQDAPAVVGHPKMDDPAYGWLRNPRVEGGVLLCDACDVDPDFAQTLKDKRFKHKSLSFYLPDSPGNPKPGSHYIKHLGLLGARAPAVKGLKPIQLAADDGAVTVELCEAAGPISWALRSLANAMGRLRDWHIQERGIEAADGILPAYVADDLRSAARDVEAASDKAPAIPLFASPQPGDPMANIEDLAAREADLTRREAELAAREKSLETKEVALAAAEGDSRKKDDAAFVDGLIAEGRLAPGEKDSVLAELAAMDDGAAVIELAADEGKTVKLTPRQAYRSRLSKAPKLVEHGEFDKGKRDPAAVDFAAPAGYTVSPLSADINAKATAYRRAHPGIDYATALAAVLK